MYQRILLAAAAACALSAPLAAQTKPMRGSFGYDATAMDSAVKPGDDFYSYVNGHWDKTTEIPSDHSSLNSFVVLRDKSDEDVRDIVTELGKGGASSTLSQQVGDYFGSYMDEARIDALGAAPLRPYLARIAAAKTRAQLLTLFVKPGYAAPIELGITPDFKDPTHYVAAASQATLGLPNREYYLSTDGKMVAHRAAYRTYIVTMQRLAGLPGGAASADRIINLETRISKDQWESARRRDIDAIYNPMTRAQLTKLAPQFAWDSSLAKAGLSKVSTVIVTEPSAVASAGRLFAAVPLSTWKEWLAFRFASDHGGLLAKPIDDARFAFYSTQLKGVTAQQPRWKRGVGGLNGALGEAVGEIYVKSHYPPAAEAQMSELISNLRASYHDRIVGSSWMDEATKKEALAKLAAFDPRIGHPVNYIDYSTLKVVKGDALGNSLRAGQFDWDLQLSRLPKPVDRELWGMTPQTVNAYYDPTTNQITFPAAILQAPFFDPNADAALNYGSIGAVIGHEMGHGFDDQGSKFDGSGALRNWWTAAASKGFASRTAVLAKQYDGYSPLPGLNVNGKLTMGENIGDLSGIESAYGAYQKYVAVHGPAPVIDGLTGDQRFFIGFAQVWQGKVRDEQARQLILIDPHSPGRFRTNGIVRNVDAWYKAFNVQPGDKLYLPPEQRVHIW